MVRNTINSAYNAYIDKSKYHDLAVNNPDYARMVSPKWNKTKYYKFKNANKNSVTSDMNKSPDESSK